MLYIYYKVKSCRVAKIIIYMRTVARVVGVIPYENSLYHNDHSLEKNCYEIHQFYLCELMVQEKATWKWTKS
jgi:hypothetical protein